MRRPPEPRAGRPPLGTHTLSFENGDQPAIGAYLVNAARRASGDVGIIGQRRNETQRLASIEFVVQP